MHFIVFGKQREKFKLIRKFLSNCVLFLKWKRITNDFLINNVICRTHIKPNKSKTIPVIYCSRFSLYNLLFTVYNIEIFITCGNYKRCTSEWLCFGDRQKMHFPQQLAAFLTLNVSLLKSKWWHSWFSLYVYCHMVSRFNTDKTDETATRSCIYILLSINIASCTRREQIDVTHFRWLYKSIIKEQTLEYKGSLFQNCSTFIVHCAQIRSCNQLFFLFYTSQCVIVFASVSKCLKNIR